MEAVDCPDQAAWEAWLEAHHADRDEVWLRIAKKGSGHASVTAEEGSESALCFGWIDGRRRGLDATHFLQRYSPRRRRSAWSQINVERVVALLAAGRMRPAGLAEVERARADGRWDAAYASQATAEVPDDLAAALARDPAAQARFDALGKTERYQLLLRLMTARGERARGVQVERIVASLGADASPGASAG